MQTSDPELLAYLYDALRSTHGLYLTCDDPARLRQHLYKVRNEDGDPALQEIVFVISPIDPNQLWLVKKETGDD